MNKLDQQERICGWIVVLVEICGLFIYYQQECYAGIAWCIFWIMGIIYYEEIYKRTNHK